jgi:Fur family ferric uptake transcriptional regulator
MPASTPSGSVRQTRQRSAILEAITASDEFKSAQQWHEYLRHSEDARGEAPSIGLATVYRTLQSLAESGEVDSVRADDGETLYRRCESPDAHHHHLRCRVCGAAEEIEGPVAEAWASSVATRYGYSSIEHTIELTGICGPCAAKGAE